MRGVRERSFLGAGKLNEVLDAVPEERLNTNIQ